MRNAAHDFGNGNPAPGFAAVRIAGRFEFYDERETSLERGGRFVVRGSDDRMMIAAASEIVGSRVEVMGRSC